MDIIPKLNRINPKITNVSEINKKKKEKRKVREIQMLNNFKF